MKRLPDRSLPGDQEGNKREHREHLSAHVGLEEAPDGFERMAAFYAERARGGAGLIVTGGFAPNDAGRVLHGAAMMSTPEEAAEHRVITDAVHAEGGLIALQILHAGRYAAHLKAVGPSPIQAPISPITPRELTSEEVEETIRDFARCAALAKSAGDQVPLGVVGRNEK